MSTTATTDATPTTDRPRHRRAPMVLVVVATVIALVSATTTWVRVQALNTDRWVAASTEILAEPEVQAALANYLVDELYASGDVTNALESALPENLQGLAGPLAGAFRDPLTQGVEQLLNRPRIQQAWKAANRLAHETLVAIVRDDTRDNVSTSGGAVVLDLGGVVRDVGAEIGIPESVLDRIPADAGRITIFESDELANVQDTVKVMDVLSWFLFLVVVALYALAVYLAADRRREMLRNVGISLAIGGATLVVLRGIAVRVTVDTIVEVPANRSAASYIAEVFTQLLADMAWTAVILGLLIAGFAALLGSHRWAVAIRGWLGRTSNPAAVITGAGFVILILLNWWGPGHVFQRWVTGLTVLALFIGAVVALTALVRAEAETEDDSETGGSDAGSDTIGSEAALEPADRS